MLSGFFLITSEIVRKTAFDKADVLHKMCMWFISVLIRFVTVKHICACSHIKNRSVLKQNKTT